MWLTGWRSTGDRRDAARTPEPVPPERPRSAGPDADAARFVIQQHHARSLHWDLRLEHAHRAPEDQGRAGRQRQHGARCAEGDQEQGKKDQIKVAAFDNIPAIAQYVKDGTVVSTLDQYGAQQASNGIDYAMKMIAGENFSGWQKTEIKLITKDNVG